ncbi:MAG: hypothetical protein ACKE51_09120 [Methylococcaceae bacterium]
MNYELEYVDYDDMDEFSLPDHIEFNNDQPEEFCMETLDTLSGY